MRHRLAVGGAALACALAGCTKEPEPVRAAEPRGASSGEPSPSSGGTTGSGNEPARDLGAPQSNTPGLRPAIPIATAPAESVRIGAAETALSGCLLEVTWDGGRRQSTALDLPGDCTFARTRSGVQIEDTPGGKAALIVSSHPLEGRPGDCDTRVRAIVIAGERAAVSKDQQTMRTCGAQGPFDTLMFHVLASSTQALQ